MLPVPLFSFGEVKVKSTALGAAAFQVVPWQAMPTFFSLFNPSKLRVHISQPKCKCMLVLTCQPWGKPSCCQQSVKIQTCFSIAENCPVWSARHETMTFHLKSARKNLSSRTKVRLLCNVYKVANNTQYIYWGKYLCNCEQLKPPI